MASRIYPAQLHYTIGTGNIKQLSTAVKIRAFRVNLEK
jgi:hypothetical protein